jgi:hypothetical protein
MSVVEHYQGALAERELLDEVMEAQVAHLWALVGSGESVYCVCQPSPR